jgi:hypothetical protein
LVHFNVRVDNFQFYTKFVRYDWLYQMGAVGGIYSFYAGSVIFLLSYFTKIDYLTTVITKLFLEESSDKKFYKKFIDESSNAKKKNCC